MILLQRYGFPSRLGREEQAIYTYAILERVPVRLFEAGDLTLSDLDCCLLVGSVETFEAALSLIGVAIPKPNYYPSILQHTFGRHIWKGVVSDIIRLVNNGVSIFSKPFDVWKQFPGQVFHPGSTPPFLLSMDPDMPVWLSDVICIESEYRCYVLDHCLVACCQYTGEVDDQPDMSVVLDSMMRLSEEESTPCSYVIDFGKTTSGETVLIENGDMFAVGRYQGISDRDYYRCLKARWDELTNKTLLR